MDNEDDLIFGYTPEELGIGSNREFIDDRTIDEEGRGMVKVSIHPKLIGNIAKCG